MTEAEQHLMQEHGLSREQIGYRRRIQENFRGLAKQEYAEDAEACFLASGDCFFETSAIDGRLAEAPEPMEQRMRGDLQVWLPPQAGTHVSGGGGSGGRRNGGRFYGDAGDRFSLRHAVRRIKVAFDAAGNGERRRRSWDANTPGRWWWWNATIMEPRCWPIWIRFASTGTSTQENGQEGFLTSSLSRNRMLSELGSVLVQEPRKFASMRLLRECRTFVRLAKRAHGGAGRRARRSGAGHGDCSGGTRQTDDREARAGGDSLIVLGMEACGEREKALRCGIRRELGDSGSAADQKNAGRRAEPSDAGRGRECLGGEVPEQPSAFAGAAQ